MITVILIVVLKSASKSDITKPYKNTVICTAITTLAMVETKETKVESGTKVDRLTEDVPIPRQNFYCVSFLSPEGIRNCTLRALKIRGVYDTKEEARERCEELQTTDPNFHVFVGDMGKWCPWDPDPNNSQDQQYQQKELNDLMKGYEDNLTRAKKMQHQRKDDMVKNAAYETKTRKEEVQTRLKKKLEKNKVENRMNEHAKKQMSNMLPKSQPKSKKLEEFENKEKGLESQTDQTKKERDRLFNNDTKLTSQKANLSTIDDKLEKIKALYNKLQTKDTSSTSTTSNSATTSTTTV